MHPYSDVSFRILMRIADVLMNNKKENFIYLKETETAPDDLLNFYQVKYENTKV